MTEAMYDNRSPSTSKQLACVPNGIPAAERPAHFELIKTLFGAGNTKKSDAANGYAFQFAAESLNDVFRFIANERKCCPFLSFNVEISPDEGPVTLRLTGPQGTREFLDAELSI